MKKSIIFFLLVFSTGLIYSQKKGKDTLDTEIIRVVKPYNPSVSDAFKIKNDPTIDSIQFDHKQEVNYEINSIPVASTFVPEKGKAKRLTLAPRERFYSNYASIGFGNYLTPFAEVFMHYNLSNYSDLGTFINFQSSLKGGIDDIVLDDTYSDFGVDIYYRQTERDFDWQVDAGIKRQMINYYGLPDQIDFSEDVIESILEQQHYGTIYLGGKIELFESLIHDAEFKVSDFFDDYENSEYQVNFDTNIEFPVWGEYINTYISIDYLNGGFNDDYLGDTSKNYNFINAGVSPNFSMYRDDWTINIGANLYYSFTDNDNDESKFYYYPNVTASYKINGDNLIAYGGVTGDLTQNSYQSFVEKNPFVSPTLNIKRTDQQYVGFIGAKGKISSNFNFNTKVSYGNEIDKPLYQLNPTKTTGNNLVNSGYEAGNSFQVIYDEVQTINAYAEIIYDFTDNIKFGGNVDYNSYSLDNEDHAWNLPYLQATLLAKYQQKKWFADANLYFVSDRKDQFSIYEKFIDERVTSDAYFDINLNGGYYFNDSWSTFLKLNNILNQNYDRFSNFKVQGFQIMAGVTYRFEFN